MRKTYINGTGCLSAQKTFDTVFLEEAEWNKNDNVLFLKKPNYKDFISPIASRRMANGIKNGIVASAYALKEANIDNIDAIITGTGMGCIEDSEKFLKTIIDNNEQYLTPTAFIQSTHNTVGAQIALTLQCKGYNFTYVNGAISFESALLDAKMQIDEDEANSVLVGGVDENGDYTISLFKLAGYIKENRNEPYHLLEETTKGYIYGEGACFFVLENEKKDSTYAQLIDVEIKNVLQEDEVEAEIKEFLKLNKLEISDIDAVVLGYNGDIQFDSYYKNLADNAFANTPQVYYKHLSGEYNTVSAFGLWVGSKIIKTQTIPELIKANSLQRPAYNTILLYNQFNGKDHSFTLISNDNA